MIAEWKFKFRMIELKFFQRPESDWPTVFQKKLKKLDSNYADRHLGHILVLNKELELFPALTEDDFDGSIRVRDLQNDVVEPRVPGQTMAIAAIEPPDDMDPSIFGDLKVKSKKGKK
jgi:hypothetical protein